MTSIEKARELYRQYLINFDDVCAVHINAAWEIAVSELEQQLKELKSRLEYYDNMHYRDIGI